MLVLYYLPARYPLISSILIARADDNDVVVLVMSAYSGDTVVGTYERSCEGREGIIP